MLNNQIAEQNQEYHQHKAQIADLNLALKSQNHQAQIMEKTAQFANEDSKRVEVELAEVTSKLQ